jgi:putative DNA primase/helicase
MSTSIQQSVELHPDDLADLRRSGLSDDTILSMGCSSLEADTIRLHTGVEKVASGGYCVPYLGLTDQTGQPYRRWRLRQTVDEMRYVAGVGDDPQLYVPPGLVALPGSELLVVTEGEKKAAKAVQEGVHCVAVQGVWSWLDPADRAKAKVDGGRANEDGAPLTALVGLASKYKHVLILGDSDLIDNFQARVGFELLSTALSRRGVRTAFGFCPPLVIREGEARNVIKQGLDDWLIADRYLALRSLPALFRGAEVVREGVTDSYNSIEFADVFKDQLAYSQGIWRHWDGVVWVDDKRGERLSLMSQIAELYRAAADKLSPVLGTVMKSFAGVGKNDLPLGILLWSGQLRSAIKSLDEAAITLGGLRGIESALKLAQSHMHVHEDVWNRDPHLLAVKNGVVDLRTSELLPASPMQWISKCAGATYNPGAKSSAFERFLERVQPDPEIREYLQRLAGYSATGTAKEQKFFTFVGGGANGKGTYTGLIMDALGSYAMKGPLSLLVEQSADRPRNDLAALDGARLVSISETPDNLRLDETVVKAVTGQDLISARFLHREFFQFRPCFTPILDTNHQLRPRDPGEAIWRRMVVIPWSVTIPVADRNEDLRDDLLKGLPGILAWIIEGARLYHESGLPRLEQLAEVAKSLKDSCDDLGRWLEAHVEHDAQARTQSSILYRSFKAWNEAEGNIHTIGQRTFTQRLEDKGFTVKKNRGLMVWAGLRLRQEHEFLDEVEQVCDPEPETVAGAVEQRLALVIPAAVVAGIIPSIAELATMPGGSYVV